MRTVFNFNIMKKIVEFAFASMRRNLESLFWQSFKIKRSVLEIYGGICDKPVAFRLVEACFYANCFNFQIMKKSAELAFASTWRNMEILS